MNSVKTLRHVIDHPSALIAPKLKILAETLPHKPDVAGISNLKIMTRRETPVDKEKELGRWKLIGPELKSCGYLLLGEQ